MNIMKQLQQLLYFLLLNVIILMAFSLQITCKKLYGPFFWMGFNCPKATEPIQGDSLIFTTKFPGVPGTLIPWSIFR